MRFGPPGVLPLSLVLLASGPACSPPAPAKTPPSAASEKGKAKTEKTFVQKAEDAARAGDFARAETLYEQAEARGEKGARAGRAQIRLITGRYAELESVFEGDTSVEAALLVATSHQKRGQLDEALAILEEAAKKARGTALLEVSLGRGEILVERGQREQARPVLLSVVEAANRGDFDKLAAREAAHAWGLVGRAAHLLRSPDDTNDAFNESELLAPADVPLLLARARLFLEKFDFAHTEEVLAEAEKLAPHHPDVLVARAHLLLEAAFDFAAVEKLAGRALMTNPGHAGAHFLLAGSHLRNLEFAGAKSHVEAALSVNPRDLEVLSMQAAILFLSEDAAGFEAQVEKVLALNPEYADVFRIVGHYAEWEHRYPDIEKLMRRAVRIDREDGRARTLLGLTLVRSGSDAAGVLELQRAFELDPFNVRVLNTLDLYEKLIPAGYVDVERGPFRFRFPKDEAALLERYVPPLAEQAYDEMRARYGYAPPAPVGIEIYASREEFSVRTSGLPRTAIQGVCFGRKLATMSPIGAPGNLGMTLWHELGHVFHIGLSENRVPRWLTEGLAEWETKQRNVGWNREMDLDFYRALDEKTLPPLGSMSRAFTHARRMQDVATAYYASGEIATWIVESHGEKAAVELLGELGKKRLPNDVVPEVLGASFESLDAEFVTWAKKSVARFDEQFVSLAVSESVEELTARAKQDPNDYELAVRLAVAYLEAGNPKEASARLEALAKQKFHPQVAFFRARLFLAEGKKNEALGLFERLLKEGHDGFEVRMMLARLLIAERKFDASLPHLEAATKQDPRAEEPWSLLATLALQKKDQAAELDAVQKWAELSEHDPVVHRRLVELLLEARKHEAARTAAQRAIWADLAGMETHRLAGLAWARSGDLARAEFEWESALLCPGSPPDVMKLATTWKEELSRRGRGKDAALIEARVAAEARTVAEEPEAP